MAAYYKRKFIFNNTKEFAKKNYNFDYKYELSLWKYSHHLSLGIFEYIKISNSNKCKILSNSKWEKYIFNKYQSYSVKRLIEFKKFLIHTSDNNKIHIKFFESFILFVFTALIGKMGGFVIDDILTMEFNLMSYINWFIKSILLMYFLIPFFSARLFKIFFETNIETNFFKEYISVIETLIESIDGK